MAVPDARIFKQVEATADVYPPTTYVDLLSYYSDLTVGADAASGEFIPLTQVQNSQRADGHILFAIGVIPPAVKITGRLLDRSASSLDEIPFIESNETVPEKAAEPSAIAGGCGQGFADIIIDDQFWIDYVCMCKRMGVEPEELAKVINKESGWNPNAHNASNSNSAKGLSQLVKRTATNRLVKMTDEEWDNYECMKGSDQLPFIEKSFGRSVRGRKAGDIYAANAGGLSLGRFYPTRGYMSADYIDKYLSADDKAELEDIIKSQGKTLAWMDKAYRDNKEVDLKDGDADGVLGKEDLARRVSKPLRFDVAKAIERGKAAASSQCASGSNGGVGGGGNNNNWSGPGKEAAEKANMEAAKLAETGLNYSEKGQKFLAAQAAQVKALYAAVQKMKKTPPLRLLVNPDKFGVKGEKIVADGNWSRNGPIVEHWGDNQDTISGSGKLAGFFAMDTKNASAPGLTRYARNLSESWQNLQSLFLLYKNNGAIYLPEILGSTGGPQNLSMLGSIYIYYDNILYIGSFSSFNLSEEDTKPFTANYSFEFTVRAAFVLDRTDDDFTYGAPQLFPRDIPGTLAPTNQSPTANVGGQEVKPGETQPPAPAPPLFSDSPNAPNFGIPDPQAQPPPPPADSPVVVP